MLLQLVRESLSSNKGTLALSFAHRFIVTTLVLSTLGGCKIVLQSDGGGFITTESGAIICTSESECEPVEVVDLEFDETFVAVPDTGYRFSGWRRRDRGLCGGSDRNCRLFTSGFAGNSALLAFLESDEQFYLEAGFELDEEGCSFSLAEGMAERSFNYDSVLRPSPQTLSAGVQSIEKETGDVVVNGVDTSAPPQGFVIDWGDGAVESGVFFPMRHTYSDLDGSYQVTLHRFGEDPETGVSFTVFFGALTTTALVDIDVRFAVSIPSELPEFNAWTPPASLSAIDAEVFQSFTKADAEYILSLTSKLALEAVECNVDLFSGGLRQVILSDDQASGGYAAWFAQPATVGLGAALENQFQFWSSYIHEISHNVTLNYPKSFSYGEKTGGSANAIWSETVAQIFQHSIGYELVNRSDEFGISDALAASIERDLLSSFRNSRRLHDEYIAGGLPYLSWNDQSDLGQNNTLLTFSSLAYKYTEYVEERGGNHMADLKEYMCALSIFDEEMLQGFDPRNDSTAGAVYRSTLMITPMQYVFGDEVVGNLMELGFPIDEEVRTLLLSKFEQRCGVR